MANRVVPLRVGDVELLVETVPVAGTERTSKLGDATKKVVDAFADAEQAILAIAARVAAVVEEAGRRATRPSSLQVEFGLSFSAEGNVIVAGASAEASLNVTVTYDHRKS